MCYRERIKCKCFYYFIKFNKFYNKCFIMFENCIKNVLKIKLMYYIIFYN